MDNVISIRNEFASVSPSNLNRRAQLESAYRSVLSTLSEERVTKEYEERRSAIRDKRGDLSINGQMLSLVTIELVKRKQNVKIVPKPSPSPSPSPIQPTIVVDNEKVGNLQARLIEVEGKLEDLDERYERVKKERDIAVDQLNAHKRDIKELETELAKRVPNVDNILNNEIARLKSQVEVLRKNSVEKDAALMELEDIKKKNKIELDRLKNEQEQADRQRGANIDREQAQLSAKIDDTSRSMNLALDGLRFSVRNVVRSDLVSSSLKGPLISAFNNVRSVAKGGLNGITVEAVELNEAVNNDQRLDKKDNADEEKLKQLHMREDQEPIMAKVISSETVAWVFPDSWMEGGKIVEAFYMPDANGTLPVQTTAFPDVSKRVPGLFEKSGKQEFSYDPDNMLTMLQNLTAPYLKMFDKPDQGKDKDKKQKSTKEEEDISSFNYQSVRSAWSGDAGAAGLLDIVQVIADSLGKHTKNTTPKVGYLTGFHIFRQYLDWLLVKVWTGRDFDLIKEDTAARVQINEKSALVGIDVRDGEMSPAMKNNQLTAGTWERLINFGTTVSDSSDRQNGVLLYLVLEQLDEGEEKFKNPDLFDVYQSLYGPPSVDNLQVDTLTALTGIKIDNPLPEDLNSPTEDYVKLDGTSFDNYGLYSLSVGLKQLRDIREQPFRNQIPGWRIAGSTGRGANKIGMEQLALRQRMVQIIFFTPVNFNTKPAETDNDVEDDDEGETLFTRFGGRPRVNNNILKSAAIPGFGRLKRALNIGPSLTELIAKQENLTVLSALLAAVGLDEFLNENKGPFTVLAPTDKAFEKFLRDNKIPNANKLKEVEFTSEVKDLLLYHVYKGVDHKRDYQKEKDSRAIRATMQSNKDEIIVDARPGSDVQFIDRISNRAQMLKGDLDAKNGVVHIINHVLEFTGFELSADIPNLGPVPTKPPVSSPYGSIPMFEKVAMAVKNADSAAAAHDLLVQLRDDLKTIDSKTLLRQYPTKDHWAKEYDQLKSAWQKHQNNNSQSQADSSTDESTDILDQIYDSYYVTEN